jgi:Na+/H+ antiporter NhaD/arsenite permease-like protein
VIATGHLTGVNKAAIAVFIGTVGWVVYICYGTDYVMAHHAVEYLAFLAGNEPSSDAVKYFIYDEVFLYYVGRAASIVMFLLATMSIIEILNNNGCFDFISKWIKTRNSKRLLWTITLATFIISANLDNLTTTLTMLVIMRQIVQNRRQRMLVGSAIVIAANCGGCFTVIGDPTGLLLWGSGAISATHFSSFMALPAILAWIIPTAMISRQLPDRLDTQWSPMPYRGDDTKLNTWQRLVMLFVGIGGLWFIPTFHNLAQLSPFLGALCVLALLWIVNEVFNRKLMNSGQLVLQRVPSALQYGVMQMMFFVMGLMLVVGIVQETDAIDWFISQSGIYIKNVWAMGAVAAAISSLLDNFATALSFISLNSHAEQNDMYWKIVSFASGVGGNLLCIGSVSGLALMKMENMRLGWYVQHVTWRVLCGLIVGYGVLFFVV